jgi:hypothetical protein
LPFWDHLFAVRLSADLRVTVHDVALYFDPMKPPFWTIPRVIGGLNLGFSTDIRLKKK